MKRLRSPINFERVRREGQSWAHPLIVLAARANQRPNSRYGIIVSKKVGHAVQRNRARRLIREALRAEHMAVQPGWDIVIIARMSIAGQRLGPVQAALQQLLHRARLYVNSEVSTS